MPCTCRTATATEPGGAGYVTVWSGGTRPTVSNLKLLGGTGRIADHVATAVGSDGVVDPYTLRSIDLVADVTGWYL
jgi:hypothetical protein